MLFKLALVSWLDPSCENYQFWWQCSFARSAHARGMVSILHAQSYISKLRAMHRWLRQSAKPSSRELSQHFQTAGSPRIPGRWILDRNAKRLDRAIDRGESTRSIERRGLLDPLRLHSLYRGIITAQHLPNRRYSYRRQTTFATS